MSAGYWAALAYGTSRSLECACYEQSPLAQRPIKLFVLVFVLVLLLLLLVVVMLLTL